MLLATYNPSELIVVLLGVPVQGYADGTFVKIEYDEDLFSLQVGAGGDGVRTLNQNRAGKITVTLLQGSPTNLALQLKADLDAPLDRTKPAGKGTGPCTVTDLNGTILASCETGWVMKIPGAEYGKEAGTREWVIQTHELSVKHGGANQ